MNEKEDFMKRQMKATALSLVMALSLTACSGGGAPVTKGGSEAKGEADKSLSGTVTVWSWDVALAHLQEEAEKFNEIYPDVEFNFEEMGVSQVYSKITTCLQSGIGLPDVVSHR